MASYIIVEPASLDHDQQERAVLVRDGFAFFAFIVPLIWFLWHRMWLEGLAVLATGFALAALGMLPGYESVATVLSLLLAALIGLEAQALRVAALGRRGWTVWGVVDAHSRQEAELRYAAEAEPEVAQRPAAAPPSVPATGKPRSSGSKHGSSLGLLDYPRRS